MIFGKHINRYYLRYSWVLLIGIASLVMVDWIQLKIPELYRMTLNGLNYGEVEIDGILHPFDMDFLLDRICRPMLFTILALLIGRFVWRICFFGSGIRMETDLRRRMFAHCRTLSQQYYNENKVGTLMSLFTNDIETVQDCFGSGILMLADAALLGGLAIFKMIRMHPLLALLSMIPMVFLFLIGTVIGKKETRAWDKRQEAFSKLSDFSQESFSGISVIKAFVRETAELMAFDRLNDENEKTNVDFTKVSMLLHVLVSFFVESVTAVILGYGGYLVHRGVFNAGQLFEFIGYFTSVIWPVMAISELIDMHSQGKASLDRISELLDAKPDVTDRPDVTDPDGIRGEIEFRSLSFRYPGAYREALHDVSFRIRAGESVGIIGRTGSGKTTVADLILRTYNVPDGTLFIDGHDVNTIPIDTVRKYSAYVPQDNFLFSDTIENNIAFASDSGDPDAVVAAAKMSDVHGDISEFPQQYQTVLGERGVTVSGGQKQRISIARALMKDAPILILDDSVSAVDTGTEKKIIDALEETRRGKTTILIAHRVSTVERMDKIIYIDEGRIAGVGPHAELYETCPQYRRTVELQRLEDGKEDAVNA